MGECVPVRARAVHAAVSQLQTVAGLAFRGDAGRALDACEQIAGIGARLRVPADRIVIGRLLLDALRRIGMAAGRGPVVDLLDWSGDYERCLAAISRLRRPLTARTEAQLLRFETLLAERHTQTHLSAREIANTMGVTLSHLSRALVQWTGHGFLHHLNVVRVRHAQDLLVGTSLTVKEVAAHAGFSGPSTMDRQFRRLAGLTPSRYRCLALESATFNLGRVEQSRARTRWPGIRRD